MLDAIKKFIGTHSEFSKRVKRRHELFWSDPNAELIRNTQMSSEDPIDKWLNVEHWQRKLSNKYNSREFALKMGCKVPDLYWKGADIDQLDFNALPDCYIIRPTIGHSSKHVFIMDNGFNLFDQQSYSPEVIGTMLKERIAEVPHLEFLVEEFLQEHAGEYKILNDYKFFCFNGEIASCEAIKRTGPKSGFSSFYDENWNEMEPVHPGYTIIPAQPKPTCLEEMVAHAKKLSRAYKIFVRIDFYATTRGAVFGEFTPTPGLGNGFSRYGQKLLVSYWDKYCKGLV